MPAVLVVLLPPSEGKAPGGDGPAWTPDSGRFPELARERERIAKALARAGGGSQKVLGVKGDQLVRAKEANAALLLGAPTLPAFRRFTGVVWEHLRGTGALGAPDDPLPTGVQRQAKRSVLVISGVTGLSAWDDPLPDFRLKLSVSLGRLGRIDKLWRDPVTAALEAHLAGNVVVDLLPNEHRAAWTPDPDGAGYTLLRPQLLLPNGKPAGHWGKAAKGLLARDLLTAAAAADDDVERTISLFQAPEVQVTL
jgi:cytoplasmic iron level regulating protein YaaA (DUF328/UPF0246 family)